jgi:lincosamide nucleotidyltransferase A/C/D/E
MMSAADVEYCLDVWERAGITVWLDGGWGVDALVGRPTREHDDLDIAIALAQRESFLDVMRGAGFEVRERESDVGFVMQDTSGRKVDVHVVGFATTRANAEGEAVYGGIEYAVGSLDGTGTIGGRPVQCVSAKWAMTYHTRYEPDDDDYRDVCVLSEAFGIPLPPPYDTWATRPTPR